MTTPRHRPTGPAIVAASCALIAGFAAPVDRVSAEPLDAIVRAKLAPALPAGLEVARIYFPADLAGLDSDPRRVAVELPRALRAGRSSIKLTVRGRRTASVPVAIAPLGEVAIAQRMLGIGDVIGEADIAIERRALAEFTAAPPATLIGAQVTTAIAAGAAIAAREVALPPPLARGTQIEVEVRRGAVHIRGVGTLELAARPGEPAAARLTATRLVVHGRLVAPATLIVGDLP
jgi:flagella basal body P-ring formation protein FlgA